MGATEIIKILEKETELTAIELAERIGCSNISVNQSIRRLVKEVCAEVKVRKLSPEEKLQRYGKRVNSRVFVYFIDGPRKKNG